MYIYIYIYIYIYVQNICINYSTGIHEYSVTILRHCELFKYAILVFYLRAILKRQADPVS